MSAYLSRLLARGQAVAGGLHPATGSRFGPARSGPEWHLRARPDAEAAADESTEPAAHGVTLAPSAADPAHAQPARASAFGPASGARRAVLHPAEPGAGMAAASADTSAASAARSDGGLYARGPAATSVAATGDASGGRVQAVAPQTASAASDPAAAQRVPSSAPASTTGPDQRQPADGHGAADSVTASSRHASASRASAALLASTRPGAPALPAAPAGGAAMAGEPSPAAARDGVASRAAGRHPDDGLPTDDAATRRSPSHEAQAAAALHAQHAASLAASDATALSARHAAALLLQTARLRPRSDSDSSPATREALVAALQQDAGGTAAQGGTGRHGAAAGATPSASAPTTVQVSIGTLEIRASAASAPAAARPAASARAAPRLGLDEYLRQRADGSRR